MRTLNRFQFYAMLYATVFITLCLLPVLSQAETRWYSQELLKSGIELFKENCSSCHGVNAEGTLEWKKTDSNGKYPPPPLNGSAHAWHHDMDTLRRTIREGGAKLGGTMPPFKDKLSSEEIDAVIAYFQSKWSEELYRKWDNQFMGGDIPGISLNKNEVDQNPSENSKLTYWLEKRIGSRNFADPVITEIEDIFQIKLGSDFGYLTKEGRYIFVGNLIDLKTGQNLTEIARRETAKIEIGRVAFEDKAIFPAKGEEKAVLNIFTDTSCPYCKKLHQEIPKLQDAGISVLYLPYPRGGERGPGYLTLKKVWCAKDKAVAMNIAKEIQSGELPEGNCEQSILVDEGYVLGNNVGITGTPALFKSNGEKIEGYVHYEKLIPMVLTN